MKHSFSHRPINEWNKLSIDCVTASSVNIFKNKVDTYLRRAGYTLMKNGNHVTQNIGHVQLLPTLCVFQLLLLVVKRPPNGSRNSQMYTNCVARRCHLHWHWSTTA